VTRLTSVNFNIKPDTCQTPSVQKTLTFVCLCVMIGDLQLSRVLLIEGAEPKMNLLECHVIPNREASIGTQKYARMLPNHVFLEGHSGCDSLFSGHAACPGRNLAGDPTHTPPTWPTVNLSVRSILLLQAAFTPSRSPHLCSEHRYVTPRDPPQECDQASYLT
jgi:hypothetical protein